MRRSIIGLVLIVLGSVFPIAASASDVAAADGPPRPNIVVIMLDDFAATDHRIWERLPNISRLFLANGVEAANFWGNDPLCCPGRANFLTGLEAHNSGMTGNDARLFDPRVSLATELQSAGYYTNICGKYFNGTNLLDDKFPPGWNNAAVMSGSYYRYQAWINGRSKWYASGETDYSTDVFANHCLRFMGKAAAESPLFLFMNPFAVHSGEDHLGKSTRYEAAPAIRHWTDSRCDGVERWQPANYNPTSMPGKPDYVQERPLLPTRLADGLPLVRRCRAMLSVDDWVGRTVAELVEQGRYDNTLFVLTSDNGMGWGSFRWERKIAPHTAQLPLLMSWPGVTDNGLVRLRDVLSNVDLAPTLCELAGCTMGPYLNGIEEPDGESFAGMLAPGLSSSVPTRDSILLEHRSNKKVPGWRGIMTNSSHDLAGQWFLITYATGEKEMYRLSRRPCYEWESGMTGDPCMLNNLAWKSEHAATRVALQDELSAEW